MQKSASALIRPSSWLTTG